MRGYLVGTNEEVKYWSMNVAPIWCKGKIYEKATVSLDGQVITQVSSSDWIKLSDLSKHDTEWKWACELEEVKS